MTIDDSHHLTTTSRRAVIVAAGSVVAALAMPSTLLEAATRSSLTSHATSKGKHLMNTFTAKDGTSIYYKDWGSGPAIVFSHGWPLTADAWDAQMLFFGERGYRVIAHDRRGHGRSEQTWTGNDMDTYADDLATLVETLKLKDVIHVGHSTGGGEVARYIGRHGTRRVSKAVLVSAVPPHMAAPGAAPMSVFDGLRSNLVGDRSSFFKGLAMAFFGFNRANATISQGAIDSFWLQGMMGGIKCEYDCIKAFSETDFTEDLKKMTIPTLLLQGDDDQIVPFEISSAKSAKLVPNAKLVVYPGAPHGLCVTLADKVNAELLGFFKS